MTRSVLTLTVFVAAAGCAHQDPYAPRPMPYAEQATFEAEPVYGLPLAGQYWTGYPGAVGWGYYGGLTPSIHDPIPATRDPITTAPPSSSPSPVGTRPPSGVSGGRGSRGGLANRPQRASPSPAANNSRVRPTRDEK